jgi:CRISP-associated protein Cas1
MARHYYLTRAGRLRRKDRTLWFEPKENSSENAAQTDNLIAENVSADSAVDSFPAEIDNAPLLGLSEDEMGESLLEPDAPELQNQTADESENDKPVRISERRVIPVEDVDAIWVFGEIDVNSRALNFLAQNKIPVHLFNYYGYYTGTFYPREHLQAGFVLVRQVRHYANKRLRLQLAREFVNASLYNVLRNLRYYAGRGVETAQQTEAVQTEILKLPLVKRIDGLMGCEGRARAAYYSAFASILRAGDGVEFSKRTRRPPDNMVNALLSFANGLVYSSVLTQIYRSQLDPTVSFLHEPGFRRFSLALDLAEVFKPVLADRLIFKLLNTKQLAEKHFARDLNCCYLKETGRKIVLEQWHARLGTTIEHRRLKRHVSYERLIRLECYKLVKHLTNDEPYKGFKAWW